MTKFNYIVSILLVGFAVSINAQQPVPTAITYQGSLEEAGQPANGSYDLQFQLYDGPDSGSGSTVGSAVVTEDVAVTDGVFTVLLDFGAGAFDGEARWLEIGVRDGASTGGFTLLSPFSPITPTPQALFALSAQQAANADQASNAAQADNASQLDGMNSGDFALAGHAHAALSAGDGLAGADYDGTSATTFGVGAGDGITVSTNEVAARVDGTSIDFNPSGELSMLPHGPGYGEVATVAKSGGDYTDPVAAMNDLSSWCSQTVACVLRIMPGLYDLTAPLELEPLVHIVGTGPFTALRRNDTGITSGVVDASNCGGNPCQMNNLLIATESTGSGSQSVGVYSQGGRVELNNVFMSVSSTTDAAFGILTDSDTWIVDSEFHHFGDDGSPVRATNGRMIIEESEINAQGGGGEAIGIDLSSTALLMARNKIEAVNAVSATAVSSSNSFIQDRYSRFLAAGVDHSIAMSGSDCNPNGVQLIGTELKVRDANTHSRGLVADNCTQVDASGISSFSEGSNSAAIYLRETPLVMHDSRIESDHVAVGITATIGTSSYPIRVMHSRLQAGTILLQEGGEFDDTAVAHSQLVGTVGAGVSCVSNVDGDLNDLGNTCP